MHYATYQMVPFPMKLNES